MAPNDPGRDGRPVQDPNSASLEGFAPTGEPRNVTDKGAAQIGGGNPGGPNASPSGAPTDAPSADSALSAIGATIRETHRISSIRAQGKMADIDVTDTDPANLKV